MKDAPALCQEVLCRLTECSAVLFSLPTSAAQLSHIVNNNEFQWQSNVSTLKPYLEVEEWRQETAYNLYHHSKKKKKKRLTELFAFVFILLFF